MDSLKSFGLEIAYNEFVTNVNDPLSKIANVIDWEKFREILESSYSNKNGKGGRPNFDVIIMLKILVLEEWFSLSLRLCCRT